MKRFICIAALSVLTISLLGQDYRTRFQQDIHRAAGVYHSYEYAPEQLSDAPAGYTPFYISHYGRHGSRYHTSDWYNKPLVQILDSAKKCGLLTKTGEELLVNATYVYDASNDLWGELTARGAREHQQIAQRMYDNFKPVFSSKDRNQIHCVSSVVPRCIISMANATNILKGLNPDLLFDFKDGDRYQRYICSYYPPEEMYTIHAAATAAIRKAGVDTSAVMARIFSNPAKAQSIVGDQIKFCRMIFSTWSICEDIEYYDFDIKKFFTFDDILTLFRADSNGFFADHCNSTDFGPQRVCWSRPTVKDIVDRADAALKDGKTAADLRYGHDTGILPLVSLIRLEGFDKDLDINEVDKYWESDKMICMGSNLQIIFYKSDKSDRILVKFLYQEHEKYLPALQPVTGKYYDWADVRDYFVSLY